MKYSLLPLLTIVLLSSCTTSQEADGGKLLVSATFYPLAYFASRIGGDAVMVTQVTPAGIEPHDYEPTPQQLADLMHAKVFLLNGNGIDAWAERIRDDVKNNGSIVVTVSNEQELLPALDIESSSGSTIITAFDPHIWLDPVSAKKMISTIQKALTEADPSHADVYTKNAKGVISDLQALDTEYQQGLQTCALREIISSHMAFQYLATRYNFTVLPIAGLSPDAEPSAQHLAELSTLAKTHGITVVFTETLASPRIAETIAKEAGAQTLTLNPLEGLTEKDMSEGKEYLSIMRENLQNLRTAMRCQ